MTRVLDARSGRECKNAFCGFPRAGDTSRVTLHSHLRLRRLNVFDAGRGVEGVNWVIGFRKLEQDWFNMLRRLDKWITTVTSDLECVKGLISFETLRTNTACAQASVYWKCYWMHSINGMFKREGDCKVKMGLRAAVRYSDYQGLSFISAGDPDTTQAFRLQILFTQRGWIVEWAIYTLLAIGKNALEMKISMGKRLLQLMCGWVVSASFIHTIFISKYHHFHSANFLQLYTKFI